MSRAGLEEAAYFNLNLDVATIGQASDAQLVAALRDWLGDLLTCSFLIVDEAHEAAQSSGGYFCIETKFTRAVRDLACLL